MSLIQNKRFSPKNKNVQKKDKKTENIFLKIKTKIGDMSKKRRRFLLITTAVDVLLLCVLTFVNPEILKHFLTVVLLLLNVTACIVFNLFTKRKAYTYLQIIPVFLSSFIVISTLSSVVFSNLDLNSINTNRQISKIKKRSELILSTEMSDVYINIDDMVIYTVSNLSGNKYVNKSYVTESEGSEYYYLYSMGMEIKPETELINDVYIYTPTPYTMTGYDYLVEFEVSDTRYISRVFIPGMIDFQHSGSSHIMDLYYGKDAETKYEVYRVNDYLMFQSDNSTFSSRFENVKYAEKEYFYVRYNRYMRAFLETEEVEEIGEKNVKYIHSILAVSPKIEKVNFFWVGEVENEVFVASTPVMEIVYTDGTSDISIIKDINAGAIQAVVGY